MSRFFSAPKTYVRNCLQLYAQKFKISQYSIDNHINDTKYLNFGAMRKDYLGVYKTDF